eukprot:gnl/MRDRNA2_/MRDRNA2_127034_c0_seq1.p1 gnl/MRDRNA2_/MRDRNA2_127034_c0~~gnl/MRDRNA2_/MRDRNA2_127034_c0_seq1.p1  ORF type:complete len:106 (-),score=19.40 gnl/MRDRNA2_/MRDRNA2_127034_c0_seq1:110-427(-)
MSTVDNMSRSSKSLVNAGSSVLAGTDPIGDRLELTTFVAKDSVRGLFNLAPPCFQDHKKSTAHAHHRFDRPMLEEMSVQDKTHRHKRNFYTEFADLQCREKHSAR